MAMTLPRRSTTNRPTCLDILYYSSAPLPPLPTSRGHSPHSSVSTSSSVSSNDSRPSPKQYHTRPLTPACEETINDDRISIRSRKSSFTSRIAARNPFNRRTYPQIKEHFRSSSRSTTPKQSSSPTSRRPSLPKIQTSFSNPSMKGFAEKEKPLPVAPQQVAMELQCHRCYYYAARNCNGWVMGGTTSDACEQCLVRITCLRSCKRY